LNGDQGLPRAKTGVAGRIFAEETSPLSPTLEEEDEAQ